MIFLGAGASVPFDLPTMQELTDIAIEKLNEFDTNLSKKILRNLNRVKMKPDFEAIYTILEASVDPIRRINEASPYATFLISNTG